MVFYNVLKKGEIYLSDIHKLNNKQKAHTALRARETTDLQLNSYNSNFYKMDPSQFKNL